MSSKEAVCIRNIIFPFINKYGKVNVFVPRSLFDWNKHYAIQTGPRQVQGGLKSS